MQRIVVGVDGSDNSRRALEWAIREARVHQAQLSVVSAWTIPSVVLSSPVATAAYGPDVWKAAAATGHPSDAGRRSRSPAWCVRAREPGVITQHVDHPVGSYSPSPPPVYR